MNHDTKAPTLVEALKPFAEAAERNAITCTSSKLATVSSGDWSFHMNVEDFKRAAAALAAHEAAEGAGEADLQKLSSMDVLRQALEALEPFERGWQETHGADDPADWPPDLTTAPAVNSAPVMCIVLGDFRRARAAASAVREAMKAAVIQESWTTEDERLLEEAEAWGWEDVLDKPDTTAGLIVRLAAALRRSNPNTERPEIKG